jgi:hypothetical protein
MISYVVSESGLLSKLNILTAPLLHFHRFICTTFMRVGVTQIRVTDATHRTNNLSGTPAASVNERAGCRYLAAISSGFRHICAR